MNAPTAPRLWLASMALLAAQAVHADHESAEKVLGQWEGMRGRMHLLQPSPTPRDLPTTSNAAVAEKVRNDLQSLGSDAFSMLLVEDGQLLYETYAKGASPEARLHSQSVAKSMTALAVGEALCSGKIGSLDDKAATYAPHIEGTAYGAASVRNLLRYTSGAQDPGGDGYAGIHNFRDFGALFGHQISSVDLMKKYGATSRFAPGEKFIYNGLDSEALSLAVRGATGMPLARWFEETVWKQAGAETQAGWYQDRDGNTIAQVGFFATTRDLARIGIYVLERLQGKAGSACIQTFMKEAAAPLVTKGYWGVAPAWGLGLHVGADGNTWFFGHGGQRVGINVKASRVIATNNHRDIRGMETTLMGVLARSYP